MPAAKKRIQNRGALNLGTQQVPAALKDWVHIWHGVKVNTGHEPAASIFHAGSRIEDLPFWKQFIRLPSNSLFPCVLTSSNPRKPYKDVLYMLLNMRWPMLLMVLFLVFMGNIFVFTAIVCFICREPTDWFEAFSLSYQTFTTIGFGIVFPSHRCGNVTISIESFASMMVVSAVTGLVFAKFAKPQAKVAFSKVCVVQPYGDKYLALVVRVANATQSRDVTHDVIMEAVFKVNLLRVEHKTKHVRAHDRRARQTKRTFIGRDAVDDCGNSTKVLTSYNLKLLQNNFITFRMGLAVVHLIDETSPFYGMSKHAIAQSDMLLEVAMSGVDSTLQDTVSERYIYTAANIQWGYRFAELLEFHEQNAEVVMNFANLSTVESAPIDDARYLKPFVPKRVLLEKDESDYDVRRRSHEKTRLRSEANEVTAELPSEVSEHYLLSSISRDSDVQSCTSEEDIPALPHPPVSFSRKYGPRKCSMGLEPLFEPLLQKPFGTQRIPKAPSVETRAAQRGGMQLWREEVRSGLEDRRSGDDSTSDDDSRECCSERGERFSQDSDNSRSKGLLEHERAVLNDDTSTISHEGHKDDCIGMDDLKDTGDGDGMDGRDSHKHETSRWRHRVQTTTSAVSIEVEDTPRFLRILPIHIPKSVSFMRFYQSALHVRWPKIIAVFVLSFLIINITFGFLYWMDSTNMLVNRDILLSKYELAFYLSVQTLATIGYGSIAPMPHSVYLNLIVFIESMVGIIAVTIMTGIAWAKFARPRAHIHFSSRMTITTIYGHRCLVFRAANTRHSGEVHENFFRIGVILTNRRTRLRQMYDVPLVTSEWPSIKLPATLIHVIDKNSPFYKFHSLDDLSQSRVAVIALLTGLDTTFSENVYARKMYFWDDFAYDMRFDDFAMIERDRVIVDFERFDRLIPHENSEPVVTTPVLAINS
ncbi:hypothetical protein PsorP6_009232 [Peronosclerospora sorghi]|uniref:Uncharacterized protein n=1 Tax=Peronosclerospora sorghi TaxID=230839 RepID=A0ACC0W0S5_9STRA|nr:hypothetical protein PsorP6_009232 [Peronosclerospora sorghi]